MWPTHRKKIIEYEEDFNLNLQSRQNNGFQGFQFGI